MMREESYEHCAVGRKRSVGKLKVRDKEGDNRAAVIVKEIGTIKDKPHVLYWNNGKDAQGQDPNLGRFKFENVNSFEKNKSLN